MPAQVEADVQEKINSSISASKFEDGDDDSVEISFENESNKGREDDLEDEEDPPNIIDHNNLLSLDKVKKKANSINNKDNSDSRSTIAEENVDDRRGVLEAQLVGPRTSPPNKGMQPLKREHSVLSSVVEDTKDDEKNTGNAIGKNEDKDAERPKYKPVRKSGLQEQTESNADQPTSVTETQQQQPPRETLAKSATEALAVDKGQGFSANAEVEKQETRKRAEPVHQQIVVETVQHDSSSGEDVSWKVQINGDVDLKVAGDGESSSCPTLEYPDKTTKSQVTFASTTKTIYGDGTGADSDKDLAKNAPLRPDTPIVLGETAHVKQAACNCVANASAVASTNACPSATSQRSSKVKKKTDKKSRGGGDKKDKNKSEAVPPTYKGIETDIFAGVNRITFNSVPKYIDELSQGLEHTCSNTYPSELASNHAASAAIPIQDLLCARAKGL